MRKLLFIFFTLLLLTNTVVAMEKTGYELLEIANTFEELELDIDGFEVTLKEYLDKDEVSTILHELSSDHSVMKTENANSTNYSVRNVHKLGNINVIYNVIVPKINHYQAELVVTLKGTGWDPDIRASYIKTMSKIISHYFTEEVRTFSCMSMTTSDIIINDNIENVTEKLKLRHISTQNDNLNTTKNLKILYGYSPLLGQEITIQDTPVNVQLISRTLGDGDVQLMIGTPILINEY